MKGRPTGSPFLLAGPRATRLACAMWLGMRQYFEPVWIWEKPGTRRAISNVRSATEWLLFFWPDQFLKTDANRKARAACLDAHEGKVGMDIARAAFLAAAEEAGILANDPREGFPPTASAASKRRRHR